MSFFWQMAFSQMHSSGRWLFLRCNLLADGCSRGSAGAAAQAMVSRGHWCVLGRGDSAARRAAVAEREEHSAQHTDTHDLSRRWLMFVFWGLVVCLLAGVRFLSFSGLKGPNSGPPRVVVSVDDSRGSLWFRRRFCRTSARLCCGGPLFELFGAERSKFRTPAGRSICGWFQGFTLVPEKVPQNVCEALLRGSAFWAFRGWKVRAARSWRDYHDTLVH